MKRIFKTKGRIDPSFFVLERYVLILSFYSISMVIANVWIWSVSRSAPYPPPPRCALSITVFIIIKVVIEYPPREGGNEL